MKTSLKIILLITIGLLSCNTDKTNIYESKIPVTKDFLIHEWMLDSIYGSNEFIQDWIYFTPDNKFWRCSHYSQSQLIDSSLTFKENKVFDKSGLKYSIFSLDSNNIILITTDSIIFHCTRWNEFDSEDIDRFIKTNPIKKLLNGNWTLDSSEITPTRIPSFCNELYPGSKFAFNPNGRLDIYPKDSTNKCNSYSYKVWEDDISFIEYDMFMSLDIVKLSNDKLILKSTYIPKNNEWSDKAMKAKQEGYNLYLTRK